MGSVRIIAAGLLVAIVPPALSQQIGTMVPEVHPKLTTYMCSLADGCVEHATTLVTDALSRHFHSIDDPDVSCVPADPALCPDAETCAQNCVLEGIDYESIGVTTNGSELNLQMYLLKDEEYVSVSPRVYLLAEDEQNYEMMMLVNKELTYDVDASELVCGMNGALYLSEMDASGSRSDLNPAGATYGTGYCDAQCFDVPWINGMPNLNNSGACCNEMDIWEANSRATVYTPHTCSGIGSFLCSGDECGPEGVCDKPGCGLNPFRSGLPEYYGPGEDMTVDTSRTFTVVTQFISSDGTDEGDLVEIRRIYIQDGNVIENHPEQAGGDTPGVISDEFCTDKAAQFMRLGATKGMGESLKRGMVLIFSIWNSAGDFMNWLDSGEAGPCGETEGDPADILANHPDVSVRFSNIRWGEIGSTFDMDGPEPASIPGLRVAATEGQGFGARVAVPWTGVAVVAAIAYGFLL